MDDKIHTSAPDAVKPFGDKSPDVRSATSSSDVEKQDEFRTGTTVQLKRKLQSRHLQMIAIGIFSPAKDLEYC